VPHVRRALQLLPHTRIVNGYGPTESTTFTCCYRLPRALDPGAASIPIGRPIANTEVFVVDRHLNPVPIGVPGELVIGGGGLARGYFRRPELTAEKFVAHPFSAEPEARLYRTGDVGRYLADGTIEFLGRFDGQVKIRGYRVEPGEIEAMLRRHPAVQQTVVVASDDGGGGRRLVAYVVATPGRAATVSELRNALKQNLPDYMLPSAFVMWRTRAKTSRAPDTATDRARAAEKWRRVWPWILLNSLAGPTLGVGCYQWGLQSAASGVVLPIVATTPLVVIPFAYFLDGDRPGARSLVGGMVAVAGVVGLTLSR